SSARPRRPPPTKRLHPRSHPAGARPDAAVQPPARRSARRREQEEVRAYLTEAQYAWASELARAMPGLSCTISDVVRLALDELRSRYPSSRKLEAALREHVWRDRAAQPGQLQLPGLRLRSHSAPAPRSPRQAQAVRQEGKIPVLVVADHPTFRAGLTGVLSGQPDIEVVGEVGDPAAAV